MSASFSVGSAAGRYRVEIGRGVLGRRLAATPALVLCDERFAERYAGHGGGIIAVRADEAAKDLEAMPDMITALRERGANRGTHVVAVGGGVVQDIASFAASVYMRGVAWSYAPTTLLGMVDSCIGGKSSINVGRYKNLVGTFHPPRAVMIDPEFARSLGVEQRVAGLCEAAKICFARGPRPFAAYLACRPGPKAGEASLARIITLSLRAKKWFIEIDEFDRAERQLLNFGHTFGHAIESASGFRIAHGVAVGVGMLCAIAFGRQLRRDYARAPVVGRLAAHVRELLACVPGLSSHLGAVSPDAALASFMADKKHGADTFTVILPDDRGGLRREAFAKDEAHLAPISAVFASLAAGVPA